MNDKGTNVFSSLCVERTGLTLSAKCFPIVETQPMWISYYSGFCFGCFNTCILNFYWLSATQYMTILPPKCK